jgi:hypothetical protein
MSFHMGENSTMREQQCEYMVNARFVENYNLKLKTTNLFRIKIDSYFLWV